MATVEQVLESALALPAAQRAEIARELLMSLEPEGVDDGVDEAWATEIRRRRAAIRDGLALRDWADALADIRRSIQQADTG